MSVLNKRNLLVGVAALVVVLGASVAIWGLPKFFKRSTTVKSQVTAYLLDERGATTGLLLASGDQLRFNPETGTIVVAQIKVGDEVSATGHAGEQTSYGREVRLEQISANGKTIVELRDGRGPKADRHHGPKDHADRGQRGDRAGRVDRDRHDRTSEVSAAKPAGEVPAPTPATTAQSSNPSPATAASPEPAVSSAPEVETIKAAGTIRAHLVNGRGDVDGLILSGGEQLRFSPRVGKLVIAAEQGASTQVAVEGAFVRNERGTVVRPTVITVGNQTISLGNG